MRAGFLFLQFFFILMFVHMSLQHCSEFACPSGMKCDLNTGLCRYFRIPSAISGFTQSDKCEHVECPFGRKCDSNTGRCVPFEKPAWNAEKWTENPCERLQCPTGTKCDAITGICERVRYNQLSPSVNIKCVNVRCPAGHVCDPPTGICAPTFAISSNDLCNMVICPANAKCNPSSGKCVPVNVCAAISCPSGSACNPNTGRCTTYNASPLWNPCENIKCPEGYQCDPASKLCQKQKRRNLATNTNDCPQNSHYAECGSSFPYTCNDVYRRPSACVSTCECDDGFVQASFTNVTCVPAESCKLVNNNYCATLRCSADMECVDGYCNPLNCPRLFKPALNRGCRYVLARDSRNCLIFDQKCPLV
uniref:TIL domain-containing protein n=1 Tax=Steinernema glaseri TaxID=37863 RepID=A0A1I8A112_9BILA